MAVNSADLSALLVALLRASNVPARYRYATVHPDGTLDHWEAQLLAWARALLERRYPTR